MYHLEPALYTLKLDTLNNIQPQLVVTASEVTLSPKARMICSAMNAWVPHSRMGTVAWRPHLAATAAEETLFPKARMTCGAANVRVRASHSRAWYLLLGVYRSACAKVSHTRMGIVAWRKQLQLIVTAMEVTLSEDYVIERCSCNQIMMMQSGPCLGIPSLLAVTATEVRLFLKIMYSNAGYIKMPLLGYTAALAVTATET